MKKLKGISGTGLIIIASLSMLIDHIGAVFFPGLIFMRLIGRTAFPIYAFLIAQGGRYTSNKGRYAVRLLIFAALSELPFDYAFYGKPGLMSQNVFFTLLIGLLVIWAFEAFVGRYYFLAVVSLIAGYLAADYIKCDYGGWGVMLIWMLWRFGAKREGAAAVITAMLLIMVLPGVLDAVGKTSLRLWSYRLLQLGGIASLIPLWFYNGTRGAQSWPPMIRRWAFYAFYPLHLAVLAVVNTM